MEMFQQQKILDYKCGLCKGSTTFNSTSELRNHRIECHGSAHTSYLYADGVAEQPIVYNNIGQTICKAQRTAKQQTIIEKQKIVRPQSTIEPRRFVNTARGSYTIPYVAPSINISNIRSIDARKINFIFFSHSEFLSNLKLIFLPKYSL